jgi:LacI family transcriptional regulator
MTVSRALTGARGVSPALRRRLQALARKLGYRRDTAAALLASQRRSEGRVAFREYIALFTSHERTEFEQSWTFSGFAAGVESRAEELGYRVCRVWLKDPAMTSRRLTDFLRTRNIRGGVMSPENFHDPLAECRPVLKKMACAVVGGLPRDPALHFACNDHFATAANATARALALGYRRPGFAILRRIDERGDRRFRGGYHAIQAELPRRDHLPVCQLGEFRPEPLLAWYRRYEPDVIITHNRRIAVGEWMASLGLRVPRDLGWISLDVQPGDGEVAGVDQRSMAIGAAALELVHNQLQRGEYGEPAIQKGVLIEGVWQEGKSVGKP